jgi:hypothetical protein
MHLERAHVLSRLMFGMACLSPLLLGDGALRARAAGAPAIRRLYRQPDSPGRLRSQPDLLELDEDLGL